MRLASRRSVAVFTATALLSSAGVATGLLVGTANATEVFSVSPRFPINAGATTFVISGKEFRPSATTQVTLRKTTPAAGQPEISAAEADNTASCLTPINCGNTFTFTSDLGNVAPGDYDVVVTGPPSPPDLNEVDTCPACVTVLASGNPSLSTVARFTIDRQLTLTGTNLSKAAKVEFLQTDANGAPTVVDPGITFDPNTTAASGYVNSTTLRGTYAAAPSAIPGLHKIRVTATDSQASNLIDFFQPQVNSASPAALGQGASQVPVTIFGSGFNPNSTFGIQSANTTTPDIAVLGPPTVTPTSITANVSVTPDSAPGARTVTVRGADGGIGSSATVFQVTTGPKFASSAPITPNTRGQGSATDITVNGSGFNNGSVFDFGDGTSATLTTLTSSTSAIVRVIVSATSKVGAHNVKVTNSDFGSSTLANGFTVRAAPVALTLTPASASPGTGPFNVIVDGSGFATTGGVRLALVPADGITVGNGGNVNVVNDKQLQATFTIAGNAIAGPRDVIITNLGDGGTSTCGACFGINSLSISPSASTNNVVKNLTLTPANGSSLSPGTTVRAFLPGFPAYQPQINGTGVVFDQTTGRATVNVDLQGVATGAYSIETTTGTSVLTCTACLTVTAPANPIVTTVEPNTAGQNAGGRSVTITGSNFSPGETVTFSGTGVSASNVTFVSPTSITALVAVDPAAPVGPRNVTVTNIGDKKAGSLTNGFTVTVAPVTTEIAPAQVGQGGVVDITLTGTGYTADAVADFGAGTSNQLKDAAGAASGTLVYTVLIAGNADTTVPRGVKVTNSDGGSSTLESALTITPAPVIASISPNAAKAGETKADVVFTGTGFASETAGEGDMATTTFPSITIGGTRVTPKSVSADGTSLVADIVVAANASPGKRAVFITNPDGGKTTLVEGFAVEAVAPSPPTSVTAVAGDASARVSFSGADGRGRAITGYKVQVVGDPSTARVVPGSQNFALFTGLDNGTTYQFEVAATSDPVPTSGADDRVYGTFSTPSAAVRPVFATALTSTRSSATPVSGTAVTYSGRLVRKNGSAPITGVNILVALTPDIGATRNVNVTTDGNGAWSFRFAPTYNTTVRARYNGDVNNAAVNALAYRMGVAARVTRSAPASGATSAASTTVAVRGSISPNKAGRTVAVFTGTRQVGTAVVAGNGSFSINVKLPRGTYTLRIALGATKGNVAGRSTNFTMRRI